MNVSVCTGAPHRLTLAHVGVLVAITELDGLVHTGGGTGGNGGAEEALGGPEVDLDSGVTTRVELSTRSVREQGSERPDLSGSMVSLSIQ